MLLSKIDETLSTPNTGAAGGGGGIDDNEGMQIGMSESVAMTLLSCMLENHGLELSNMHKLSKEPEYCTAMIKLGFPLYTEHLDKIRSSLTIAVAVATKKGDEIDAKVCM